MELLILLLIGLPIVFVIWTIASVISTRNSLEDLARRLDRLDDTVQRMRRELKERESAASPPAVAPAPAPAAEATRLVEVLSKSQTAPVAPPPPISLEPPPPPPPVKEPAPAWVPPARPEMVLEPAATARTAVPPPRPPKPDINWEQFMGVKGFAWVGGFALFLGIAFFVKYSFDNNLISPALRVAIGFFAGIALVVGGLVLSRKDYAALSQTLCATGVVVLYAVTFACRALYHFEFFGPIPTFLLMSLITATAFLLAVRLDALVVAILGMLGGFLTPILLSTGQDNPAGLFGYIALLDIGLILVSFHRDWKFLAALAAAGTVFMQLGWAMKFFDEGKYFVGDKIYIALTILAGFNALYLGGNALARKRSPFNSWLAGSQVGMAAAAFAMLYWFLSYPSLGQRPVPMLGCVLFIDLLLVALAWINEAAELVQSLAGLGAFALVGIWTLNSLTDSLLNIGLAFYFIFAVIHSGLPALQRRLRGGAATTAGKLSLLFPPLALVLVIIPVFKLNELSFLVWPFILLIDLIAIALAVLNLTVLPIFAVLLLTLGAIGALIFKIPADLTGLPAPLLLLGAFSIFFVAATVWLVRKLALPSKTEAQTGLINSEAFNALLPSCSAMLPFLLLIMVTVRLSLPNPTPVLGLCLLLTVMLLGLAKMFALEWLPVVGLAGVFAVESSWFFGHFDPASHALAPTVPLLWWLLFYAIFSLYPFLFLTAFSRKTLPWAASALAGPAQFLLVYRLIQATWPNSVMGLLPAAFAVPPMLGLVVVLKRIAPEIKARLTQLAFYGGVCLFFITLIFPIQFDRQWITIGWALEGAALLWLFHRVPHQGLRWVGMGLLVAAFVRLACNPAVLEYHPRSNTPIFNWYLYTYGIVTAALFLAARLLRPPRHKLGGIDARAVAAGLGVVLAFLLLNIEIADYFSPPGSTLTFEFNSNFARDMTYSIAWSLFALGLLIYGILRRIAAARYPAMFLLGITLLKLFFHDLAQLGQLYRIGAFIGVAVVAMLASFAYQRFFSGNNKAKESNVD